MMNGKATFAVMWSVLMLFSGSPTKCEVITFEDAWGKGGFNLIRQSASSVEIVFSISRMEIAEMEIDGQIMQNVIIPGVILPNNAGAPNLPGLSRFIAVPQGAQVCVEIIESRTKIIHNMNIAPAFEIPRRDDDNPLKYEKDQAIYTLDAEYPDKPVIVSDISQMRGVDVVLLGITPFQYNPVTGDLTVYKDIRVHLNFTGGNGHFGEDRLRNRWWEPVLHQNLINYESLSEVNFHPERQTDEDNVEYIIIVPDDPDFISWADSLKRWRNEQGIITGITTLSEIGGNDATLIENYINNAYYNWDIPPVAVLLLSDFEDTGDRYGITSPLFSGQASDNIYADIDGNNLPDLNIARITAQNAQDLQETITKMLDYERNPYTDPGFYLHPMLAGAWQTTRWFILNTEILYGYFHNMLGKDPVREYTIYSGTPGSSWSSNSNTYMVVNYFGPHGLSYIPATPEYLTEWNGSAERINADFNQGAFMGQHCDHGSVQGWSEPSYTITDLGGLHNEMYPYIFSDNCSTGEYTYSSPCFAEVIHRMQYGAIGIVAASGTSYSFVADVLVWGFYDGMWPDFDPGYGSDPTGELDLRPGFALAHGKYYLQASSWPYNPTYKNITIHQHHHHGGAFLTIYSEIPQELTVEHAGTISPNATSFIVSANDGSLIGLSVDGEVIGAAEGTGSPISIPITSVISGQTMRITVTKANYFRYICDVPVDSGTIPMVQITLTPENPPIQIPPFGATFDYNATLTDNDTISHALDAWCMVTLPDGSSFGPVLGPVALTLQPADSLSRNRTQAVPASAPAGEYHYIGYAGIYPGEIWSSDSFVFEKLDGNAREEIGDWNNWGDPIADAILNHTKTNAVPMTSFRVNPNPFNPTTTISYQLPADGHVSLKVFDVSGRLVATIVDDWREAGMHELMFDGGELPSGIYLAKLIAVDLSAVQKLVLIK